MGRTINWSCQPPTWSSESQVVTVCHLFVSIFSRPFGCIPLSLSQTTLLLSKQHRFLITRHIRANHDALDVSSNQLQSRNTSQKGFTASSIATAKSVLSGRATVAGSIYTIGQSILSTAIGSETLPSTFNQSGRIEALSTESDSSKRLFLARVKESSASCLPLPSSKQALTCLLLAFREEAPAEPSTPLLLAHSLICFTSNHTSMNPLAT